MRWGIQITQKVFQPGREKIHLGVGFSTEENCGGPVEYEIRKIERFPNQTLWTLSVIREKKHREKSHPTLSTPKRRRTLTVVWQAWIIFITGGEGTRGRGATGSVKSGAKTGEDQDLQIIPKSSARESEKFSTLSQKNVRTTAIEEVKVIVTFHTSPEKSKWQVEPTIIPTPQR